MSTPLLPRLAPLIMERRILVKTSRGSQHVAANADIYIKLSGKSFNPEDHDHQNFIEDLHGHRRVRSAHNSFVAREDLSSDGKLVMVGEALQDTGYGSCPVIWKANDGKIIVANAGTHFESCGLIVDYLSALEGDGVINPDLALVDRTRRVYGECLRLRVTRSGIEIERRDDYLPLSHAVEALRGIGLEINEDDISAARLGERTSY